MNIFKEKKLNIQNLNFTFKESSAFKAFVGNLNSLEKASSFNKTKILGFPSYESLQQPCTQPHGQKNLYDCS